MGTINLGTVNGEPLILPKEIRETHFHIMGNSRMGKSFFLEHMIRRDIIAGSGVCVIDPHGEMYDNLVSWLTVSGAARHRKVHLINPSEDGWSVGFNPFCTTDSDPSVRVDFMIDACMKVWGGADPSKTPRLAKCLELVFYALAAHGLSIAEARKFTSVSNIDERLRLTSNLPDWDRQQDWNEFNAYPRSEFMSYMESTNSRLIPFASKPRVQRLMGQTTNLIDFRKCMDDREIVLVNLAGKGKLSEKDAQVIGALLFADLFVSAKKRDVTTAKNNPFYCYVDECADVITEDVAKSLDQTAKFGLHLILAHHRMSQLLQYGDAFCDAIMTGAQSKVIFRIDNDDAAEELSRHLFRKEFDIESRKENLTMPVAVGQVPVWLHSHSTTKTDTKSAARGKGGSNAISSGQNFGQSVFMPDVGDAAGITTIGGTSDASISGSSWFEMSGASSSTGNTEGQSESLTTVYEERGIPYTLEELVHEGIVAIRKLPKREALVYLAGNHTTVRMKTPTIAKVATLPSSLKRTVDRFVERSDCTRMDNQIFAEIEARREPMFKDISTDMEDDDGLA